MVGLDAVTPVGPPTPRPGVAIVGDLDPACPSGALVGDVDGNCMWTVADVRLTQRLVAGLEPLTESMRKALVLSSDALPSAADVWRVHRIVAP